jgi:DNA-directed RNA polymerase
MKDIGNLLGNPCRLPMVYKPIKWETGVEGGYLNDIYRACSGKDLIHNNPVNMYKSKVVNDKMFLYINYINNQEFVINTKMLHFLIAEWHKDNSKIFGKYNKIYRKDSDLSKEDIIDSIKHNSHYWYYKNILSIASTFKNISTRPPSYPFGI